MKIGVLEDKPRHDVDCWKLDKYLVPVLRNDEIDLYSEEMWTQFDLMAADDPYLRKPERLTVTGTGFFKGTISKTFKITKIKLASATLKYTEKVYTGAALKPKAEVKAKVDGKVVTLTEGTDYTVKYTNNKKVGTATVTITGKGNFTGTITLNFEIVKKK